MSPISTRLFKNRWTNEGLNTTNCFCLTFNSLRKTYSNPTAPRKASARSFSKRSFQTSWNWNSPQQHFSPLSALYFFLITAVLLRLKLCFQRWPSAARFTVDHHFQKNPLKVGKFHIGTICLGCFIRVMGFCLGNFEVSTSNNHHVTIASLPG